MARTRLCDLEEVVQLSEEEVESVSGGDADELVNLGGSISVISFEG